jgi:hypothetical protein
MDGFKDWDEDYVDNPKSEEKDLRGFNDQQIRNITAGDR